MILCCAQCANPIPPTYDSDRFCSDRCGNAFDEDLKAEAWDEGIDWAYSMFDRNDPAVRAFIEGAS